MAIDCEDFFIYFLAIWNSSFEKFSSVCHFFIGSLNLGDFRFFKFPVYYGYQSFVWCIACKDFLPLCGWSLQFRNHFFCCAELFNFMKTICSFSVLSCPNFRVSGLILRSLIHFELILV
jgi:hypothetical protein